MDYINLAVQEEVNEHGLIFYVDSLYTYFE